MMLLKKINFLIKKVIFTLFFYTIVWITSIYNIKLGAEQLVIVPGANIILYDDLGRMHLDGSSLHLGITEQLLLYKIFATEGTQSAAVEIVATDNAVMDSIFIEDDINAHQLRSEVLAKKSALSFKNNFSLSLTKGLIITKDVNVSAGKIINSNCAAISIELPLIANIINYGKITGDFAVRCRNGGYLSGELINHGIIDARIVYKNESHLVNDTKFTLLNKANGRITGNIFLSGLTATLINEGNIGTIKNQSSLGIASAACFIENSGYLYIDRIFDDKKILGLTNYGNIYIADTIPITNLNNHEIFDAKSLLISGYSTNFDILNVGSLYFEDKTRQQNEKLINLPLGIINIKDADFVIDDSKFENYGNLNIVNKLQLSGTFTNKGVISANKLSANNYKFIVNKNKTADFKSLGEKNDKLSIINYGNISINNQSRISDFLGNINIHKNHNEQNDGVIELYNSFTQQSGCLNLGDIITHQNMEINLTVKPEAAVIINNKFDKKNIDIINEGSLQLKSGARFKSYKSTEGYLNIILNDNLENIYNKVPLLKIDEISDFSFPAKIAIFPPAKIKKNISELITIIDSKLEFLSLDIYNLEDYFITNTYIGSVHLNLVAIKRIDNILQAHVNIKSLIGFLPNSEYAQQKINYNNQIMYGVAWSCNKSNNKPLSNNLIITPNALVCKKDLVKFSSNNKFLEIGIKNLSYKVKINTENNLPALILGTTVIADNNFINSAINEQLNLDRISLYNLIINGRDEEAKQNNNGLVINGIHPLYLTHQSGLTLDKSVLLLSGNKSCALSIIASMTGNLNNFGVIGDKYTGTAIAINNYIKGSLVNAGTLQANNYALYIKPNKYGVATNVDINIENRGLIEGNIYIDAIKKNNKAAILLDNYNAIYADSIISTDINNLHIVNKANAIIKIKELSVTSIINEGSLVINNKIISNKKNNFKNTGCFTIINTFLLEKDFVNDGSFYAKILLGNNYNFFNNNFACIDILKDTTIINKGIVEVNNLITGVVNIDSELYIKNSVQVEDKSKLFAKNIIFHKNSKLINNKQAKIKISGDNNVLIANNNFVNYGNFDVKKSIKINKYFINNGNIKVENIITVDGCIENKLLAKLTCKNIGTKNNKLEIIGDIYLQPNYESNGIISGDVILHANNNRQADGILKTSENIKQTDGNFYFGAIETQKEDFKLKIENNSFCQIKHAISDDNISIINKGSLALSQGSKIKRYNSIGGELLLNIENITSQDYLLTITDYATLDVNSTIRIKPCGFVPDKISKTINIINTSVVNGKQQGYLYIDPARSNSSPVLIDTIKVGSVLLKVNDISIAVDAITAKITRIDLLEANPNILLANQTLYSNMNIANYKQEATAKSIAWIPAKNLPSDTTNLTISPVEAVVTENIIDYSLADKKLYIASNTMNLQHIYANHTGHPVLSLGISTDEDNNFKSDSITQSFDINTISIDSINIDGGYDEDGIDTDEDGLLINGNNDSMISVKDKLVINAGAKIVSGNNSSALNIIPYFIGDIINHGNIGDDNTGYGIRISNFMSGKLINKNLIKGSKAAFILNINDEVDDKDFILINKGNMFGNILIKETQNNRYNIIIDNYGVMKANSIDSQGLAIVNLTNAVNANLEIYSWNLNYINNKGNLCLLGKNYYINDKIISNYGEIKASNNLIIDNFTNNGTLSSVKLESKDTKNSLDNHGIIIADNIENITINKTGSVYIKKNIGDSVLIESSVTMLGNILVNDKADVNLGALLGKNFNITNRGKLTSNNIVVNQLINTKDSDITVNNKLSLYADSINYGTIFANDISFVGGKLVNKIDAVVYLNNLEIDNNCFENFGKLQVYEVLYLKNDYINHGNTVAENLFADASCLLTIDRKSNLECYNLRAKGNLNIINEGVLSVANSLNGGVIDGLVTVHKNNNKNQDGTLIMYGDIELNGNLTTGKIKNSIAENQINIKKDANLTITLLEKEQSLNLNNDGELIICSGSIVKKYQGENNGTLVIEVNNLPKDGETWFSATNLLQLSDKTLIAIKPKNKFLAGVYHGINIIDTNAAIIRKRKANNLEVLKGNIDKSLIIPLANAGCIFHLNNIYVNSSSFGDTVLYSSIVADVRVLDVANLDNNMEYADQFLIAKLINDPISQEVRELTGVAWKYNFFKNTKLPSSNNLIVSPVELLTNIKQLSFDFDKKVLEIGTTTVKNNNFFATKEYPAVVIGTTVVADSKFIRDATNCLVLDSINIDNINIYGGTDTKSDKSYREVNFQDALLLAGENKLNLTGKTGLTIGKNTFIHANINTALNLGLAFEGNIYNEGIIEAEDNATAIKINHFICGTITNKNTIKSRLAAIDLNHQNIKKYKPKKSYLALVNEATFSGDILAVVYNKVPEYLDFIIINKGYFAADVLRSSGEISYSITNNCSATMKIASLQARVNFIKNDGIIQIDYNNTFYVNDSNFTNNNTAIFNNFYINATLTNNAKLQIKDFYNLSNKSIIYNNNELHIENIKSDINIKNTGVLSVNNSCTNNIFVAGTLTVNNELKTIDFGKLIVGDICIKGRIINSEDYQIQIQSNSGLTIDNNFENYGELVVNKYLVLNSDFINKGNVFANHLKGNNQKFYILPNKKAIFNNIGEVSNSLTIVNQGDFLVQSNNTKSAKIAGNLQIIESTKTNKLASFKIAGAVEHISGILSAKSFDANKDSTFTVFSPAHSIFTSSLRANVAIINKGTLELAQNSIIKSYDGRNSVLCLSINKKLQEKMDPLLQVKETAIFNNESKIKIKLLNNTVFNQNIGCNVDLIVAQQGFKNIKSDLSGFLLKEINVTSMQLESSILLNISNINIIDNKIIRAYLRFTNTIDFMEHMLPANQKSLIAELSGGVKQDGGVAWNLNKSNNQPSTNNLIISPNEVAINKNLVNFDCDSKNLYIGNSNANDRDDIFISKAKAQAALSIGTEVVVDNYFTVLNNDKLWLNKIDINNININGYRYAIDYSIIDKDGLLINGNNDLALIETPGLIIGDKVNISAGITSKAVTIFPKVIGDIINNGVIGNENNAVGIQLYSPIAGTLINKSVISGKAAIDYLECKLNTDTVNFNIANKGSLIGSLLFNTQNHKSNNNIKLYNSNSIIADKIIASKNINFNIYNLKLGKIIADQIKINYLDNHGDIQITGTNNLEISNSNFNNQGDIFVNNLLLKDNATNSGNLQINKLIGNQNILENKGRITVKNIGNIKIINTGITNISNEVTGEVSVIGKLNILDTVTVNRGAYLIVDKISVDNDKINNFGNIRITNNADIKTIDNKINSTLQVDGVLLINDYSDNSGEIVADKIQINDSRLSNLIGANLHITGKAGFEINKYNFVNWGDLVVDYSLIVKSDFTTNGNVFANNINANAITFAIEQNNTLCLHNISDNCSELNIINQGNFIIGNNQDTQYSIIATDIIVSNNDSQNKDGIITLDNNIKQINGVLSAGKLISKNNITYQIEQQAASIFKQAVEVSNVKIVNKGILNIISGSKVGNYDGDLGVLVISIDKIENYSNNNNSMLLVEEEAYLSDKSKIIINSYVKTTTNIESVSVNILKANKGIIYKNLDIQNDDLTKILFGISTDSIFWQVKNVTAEKNIIQAILVPHDVTDIEGNMSYADITLSKELFGKHQIKEKTIGAINWENIIYSENKTVKNTILVAPHTIYSDKKALKINENGIHIGLKPEEKQSADDVLPGIVINLTEEDLPDELEDIDEFELLEEPINVAQFVSEPLLTAEDSQFAPEPLFTAEDSELVFEPLFTEESKSVPELASVPEKSPALSAEVNSKVVPSNKSKQSKPLAVVDKLELTKKITGDKNRGKSYPAPQNNIIITDKINVRKSLIGTKTTSASAIKHEDENIDAVIIYSSKNISSSFKELIITGNAQLIPLEKADALHINIPASITITNKGIIGDSKTGVGLKITQPISAIINNSGTIAGITAINLDIEKSMAIFDQQPYITINNKNSGVILGSLFFNTDELNHNVKIVNFNQIKSATIAIANNVNLSIENKKSGVISADYIKADKLHNEGILIVNKDIDIKAEQFINFGTAEINFNWYLDSNMVNSGILKINKFQADGYNITNTSNAKLYVNELDNIKIINKDGAELEIKKNITNNVEVIGGVCIASASDIQQTGAFLADKLLPIDNQDIKFTINNNSISSFKKNFVANNLEIINYGELNLQACTSLKSYKSFSGTLNIELPYNFMHLNYPLLFLKQEAVIHNIKGKVPLIKLYADSSLKRIKLTEAEKQNKILVKILVTPKLDIDTSISSLLAMQAIKSNSLFIHIDNPYILEENLYTSIYATLSWKDVDDSIDITTYPISVTKMALAMQANIINENKEDIKKSVIQEVKNEALPEEAEDIINHLLNNEEHLNIYKPIIQDIQRELKKIFIKDNNEFTLAMKAILPDSSVVDVRTDTSLVNQAFDNIGYHFINKSIKTMPATLLTGVNSGYADKNLPIWYCVSFSMTAESVEAKYKSNKWNSSLASVGLDHNIADNMVLGIMGSYAKSTVIPWENDYTIVSRELKTGLASCYLRYISNNLNINIALMWAKNNHSGDYNYNIISKQYSIKYATNVLGAMFEISYPFTINNFTFEMNNSLKIMQDQVPTYNIGVYEKHKKINFYTANCSMGIYASYLFKFDNNLSFDCATAITYAYNFDISSKPLDTEFLGKTFSIKYKNQSSHEFNINLYTKINIQENFNVSFNIKYSKLFYRNTIGIIFSARYLF